MNRFDGVLICTDLDGTLLKDDKTVSEENIKAVKYFKSEGGIFAIVTGRMPSFVYDIYKKIKSNAPLACANGGGLYDYEKQKYFLTAKMPESITQLIECVDLNFPDVGIQVNTYDNIYFCKENSTMEWFRSITGVEKLVCGYKEIKEPIAKIIFGSDSNDELLKVEGLLKNHPQAENFDFIRSEERLYEILPKGSGKGKSVEKLAEVLNIDKSKIIAIGDYNNDIPMFKAAKIGIAVANACGEALEAADFVTVSNEEHAIAKVIYDLKDGKYF